jgi:zinc transporter ZupT
MPLAGRIMASSSGNQLLAGIILHHIPVSFALMSMLIQSGIKNRSAVFLLFAFALMSPAGSVFSQSLSTFSGLHVAEYFPKVMGVVIGIFLHISTTILFETGEHHRFNIYKFVMILIGVALALL